MSNSIHSDPFDIRMLQEYLEPTYKTQGTTATERFLHKIATKTFLSLWSYSSPFTDKRGHATGDGKELCDLLVVFGDDVIIFSDKNSYWPKHEISDIQWKRWFKKTVVKSAEQLRGAMRWIGEHPERIFTEKTCARKLPLQMPSPERARFHLIAIASGAEEVSMALSNSNRPSIAIDTSLKTVAEHLKSGRILSVGDLDSVKKFVHIFDAYGLATVLRERDTIADFILYLTEREAFLRHYDAVEAASELDLLGLYLQTETKEGSNYLFERGDDPSQHIVVVPHQYRDYLKRPEVIRKRIADRISYFWDGLIEKFSENVLEGTILAPTEYAPSFSNTELGLRFLASETRLSRRALSNAFRGILLQAEHGCVDRYARLVFPSEASSQPGLAYIFLIVENPGPPLVTSEAQYRMVRRRFLEAYLYAVLQEYKYLKTAVGIAVSGRSKISKSYGFSEDLAVLEVGEWTVKLEREVQLSRERYQVLQKKSLVHHMLPEQEYPQEEGPMRYTRQQRRALMRKVKKRATKSR